MLFEEYNMIAVRTLKKGLIGEQIQTSAAVRWTKFSVWVYNLRWDTNSASKKVSYQLDKETDNISSKRKLGRFLNEPFYLHTHTTPDPPHPRTAKASSQPWRERGSYACKQKLTKGGANNERWTDSNIRTIEASQCGPSYATKRLPSSKHNYLKIRQWKRSKSRFGTINKSVQVQDQREDECMDCKDLKEQLLKPWAYGSKCNPTWWTL